MKTQIVKRGILLGMLLLLTVVLCACGGVSEDDISAAVESKSVDDVVALVEQYSEQDNKDDLNGCLAEEFKALCESTEYSDYEFMDGVIKKVKDKSLKEQLTEVIDDNCTNKVIAFTEGEWVRRDMTDQDGIVLTLQWNKEDGTAIVTETKNAKKTDFKNDEIKWKNIKVISQKQFSYEDLAKGDDGSTGYNQGLGKINYENKTIKCKISDVDNGYSYGKTQIWVKKDAIDPEKEIITKKDLTEIYDEKSFDKDNYYYYYEEKLVRDMQIRKALLKKYKDEKEQTIRESVTLGDSRKKVIEAFGYGHIVYQSYKDDPVYKIAKYALSEGDDSIDSKGFVDILKQPKYAVVYMNKKNSMFTKMYFSSNDKLLGIVTVMANYDKVVEAMAEY